MRVEINPVKANTNFIINGKIREDVLFLTIVVLILKFDRSPQDSVFNIYVLNQAIKQLMRILLFVLPIIP